jgi:hypothetical protein
MADASEIRKLLDACEPDAALALVSVEELAAAYCRYVARNMASEEPLDWDEDPDGWAAELYFEITSPGFEQERSHADEERIRRFLLLIVAGAANDDVLSYIGAGPFEDFLGPDESRVSWIEAQAVASATFRKALANVWIWSWAPEEIFVRIEAAAQAPLAWPEQYGPRPGNRET